MNQPDVHSIRSRARAEESRAGRLINPARRRAEDALHEQDQIKLRGALDSLEAAVSAKRLAATLSLVARFIPADDAERYLTQLRADVDNNAKHLHVDLS